MSFLHLTSHAKEKLSFYTLYISDRMAVGKNREMWKCKRRSDIVPQCPWSH